MDYPLVKYVQAIVYIQMFVGVDPESVVNTRASVLIIRIGVDSG